MNKEYKQYPDESMVWVYQSNRFLKEEEKQHIENKVKSFIAQWESHGSLVKGTYTLLHDAFVVIFADGEGQMLCGRAQSASVALMKELENELQIPFVDRMNLSYKVGEQIHFINFNDLKNLYNNGVIQDDSLVFDNTIITKKDFDNKWLCALENSWHKRYV